MSKEIVSKIGKRQSARPVLSLRYDVSVALYPSKEAKTPTVSKGGSANLRIDLLLTSLLTLIGAAACRLVMLRRRLRRR